MSIKVIVLTVSDRSSAGLREDLSGPELINTINGLGWTLINHTLLPDEMDQISSFLQKTSSSEVCNLILTTGGTGFSPRDVTPEATLAVINKKALGLVELIRSESAKINAKAYLSRAEAGICKNTLIINLPGSPKGAVESLLIVAPLIPHAIELLVDQSGDVHQIQNK
ncbi:MAG: molybdenum cofactor biosynthesis protein [Chloroflexi bacterium HGW-Chloroflexi-4]|nr:MAG: molybdenum cofactor biosynthesis protein [Chloroflexi bacterium HGW-Chloroflexi-4]